MERADVIILGGGLVGLTLAIALVRHGLSSLVVDPADPATRGVISLAVSFLAVAALFQIFDGAQVVGAGMLRGLHDTTVPMLYAGLGYWLVGLGVGVGLAFGLGWEGIGIWVGLASGLAVVAVLMLARWVRRGRLGLYHFALLLPAGATAGTETTTPAEGDDDPEGCRGEYTGCIDPNG